MLIVDTELITQQLLEDVCFDLLFDGVIESYISLDIDKVPDYYMNQNMVNFKFEDGLAFCKISKNYSIVDKEFIIILNIDFCDFDYSSINKFERFKDTLKKDLTIKLTNDKSNFANMSFITLKYDFDVLN